MTRIKICGITNRDDAVAAVAYGADALGFIAVPESPRFVDADATFEIWNCFLGEPPTNAAPPWLQQVVVVRRPEEAEAYAPDYVQYYEAGTDERHIPDRDRGIRAFRVREEGVVDEIERWCEERPGEMILLDTYHDGVLGGSGETFNWELAVEVRRRTNAPIVLAGGLTPENVGDAIAAVRPFAVDVSSGVEAEPRRKDHDKLRRFIRAVREADFRLGEQADLQGRGAVVGTQAAPAPGRGE